MSFESATTVDPSPSDEAVRANATREMFIYLNESCSAIPVGLAFLAFPLNVITIVIITVQIRRTSGWTQLGQTHLIFLAASDISVAIYFISGGTWLRVLPSNWRDLDDDSFQPRYRVLFNYIVFVTNINRLLTLYITIKRTECVLNISAAAKMRAQSKDGNVFLTFRYGILPGVVSFVISKAAPDFLESYGVISKNSSTQYFWGFSILFFFAIAVAMVVMGTIIVSKIRSQNAALRRIGSSRRTARADGGRAPGPREKLAIRWRRRGRSVDRGIGGIGGIGPHVGEVEGGGGYDGPASSCGGGGGSVDRIDRIRHASSPRGYYGGESGNRCGRFFGSMASGIDGRVRREGYDSAVARRGNNPSEGEAMPTERMEEMAPEIEMPDKGRESVTPPPVGVSFAFPGSGSEREGEQPKLFPGAHKVGGLGRPTTIGTEIESHFTELELEVSETAIKDTVWRKVIDSLITDNSKKSVFD